MARSAETGKIISSIPTGNIQLTAAGRHCPVQVGQPPLIHDTIFSKSDEGTRVWKLNTMSPLQGEAADEPVP